MCIRDSRKPARDEIVRELADVIDVKVRDKKRIDRRERESGLRDSPDRAAAHVEHDDARFDFEHVARRATLWIGSRTACSERVQLQEGDPPSGIIISMTGNRGQTTVFG